MSESSFDIDSNPSDKGFYKMVDKVVKDNGKPDCAGQVTAVGDSNTSYLFFNATEDAFVMCQDESLQACIGPFERVKPLPGTIPTTCIIVCRSRRRSFLRPPALSAAGAELPDLPWYPCANLSTAASTCWNSTVSA